MRYLLQAMVTLGFSSADIKAIFGIVAGILHLGNIDYDVEHEKVVLLDPDQVAVTARVLKVSPEQLQAVLTTRQINLRGEITVIPLKLEKAVGVRNTLAKAIYSMLFDEIVRKINTALSPESKLTDQSLNSYLLFRGSCVARINYFVTPFKLRVS